MSTVVDSDELGFVWKLEAISGAVALLFGLVAMAWPDETAVVVVVLWGIFVLVDGLGLGLAAFLSEGRAGRSLLLVGAVVALLVGLFAIFRPTVAATTVIWVLGLWLVLRGLIDVAGALRPTAGSDRWLPLVGAAFTIVLGFLFMARPGGSIVALAFLLGLLSAVRGVALLVAAYRTRRTVGTSVRAATA